MNALEQFRKDQKLTYEALATLIEVKGASTARKYCKGLSMPEPDTMRRIAEVTEYRVTANDFYGIEPPPPGAGRKNRSQRGRAQC